jgi:7,8-dihydroneopterin aldolase/epimerase/oxygenase
MGAGRDRIELRGLRLVCAVGVPDIERARPQPIEIDLDIVVDAAAAAAGDELAGTADYASALDAVAGVVTGSAFHLLESLAEAVATAVLRDPLVEEVTVALRKLQPPVPYDLATAGVRLTRART